MTTENHETPQNQGKLTGRQIKALPFIVASPTYTAGCEKAKVDRKTFYKWLENPAFKHELDRQQKAISERAFGMLAQNVTQAVECLAGLVDGQDKRLSRLASKDLLDYQIRFVEVQEIEARLMAIEKRLGSR